LGKSVTATLAPVTALLLSVAMLLMGNGLQGTLLPVRAQFEDFSALDIGVLGSSYFLGFALGCLLGARVVRRVGHIRAFTAMVSIASTISLAHALLLSPVVWWVLRAGTGFCFAALYMVIESWLNERSTNETRGLVFSVYTIVNLTVITIGQMMLTLDSPRTFALFALASILVSLAAVPVALTTAAAPQPPVIVRIRPRYLYKLSPVGFVGCFAVGLANSSFWALGPVFAQRGEGDVTAVAIFMSLTVIAGAAGQWPLGRASDRMDRRKVIVFACVGGALAGTGLMLSNQIWPPGLFVFAGLFGFFTFPLYSLCAAHMNDYVEPDGYVEAASGLLLVFGAGAVLGPLLASAVMRLTGVDQLFGFTAVVQMSAAAFTLYRMRQRARAPEAERVEFADAIRLCQTVSAFDPTSPQAEDGAPPEPAAAQPDKPDAAAPGSG
jgi:MFS family permease